MDIVAMWLIDIVFFSAGLYVLYVSRKPYALFIMQSPRLSVTHANALHFYFLRSRPGMGAIYE